MNKKIWAFVTTIILLLSCHKNINSEPVANPDNSIVGEWMAVKVFSEVPAGWSPTQTKWNIQVQHDSSYTWVEGNQTISGTMGVYTQKTCISCPASVAYFVKDNTIDTLFFPYSVSNDTLQLGGIGTLTGTSVVMEGITTMFIKIK